MHRAEAARMPPSPLERRVPRLRGRRLALGARPTPVRRFDHPAGGELWTKDEGRSAHPYGGNKVRKLEWLLPRLAGRSALVTVGAVGSNHVLATAWYARRAGVRTHAILVPQPDLPGVRRNAAVTAQLAYRLWPASSEVGAVAALGRSVAAARAEDGRRPAVVWIGGSTPAGLLGWVDAALELGEQVADGLLPVPTRIVVPAGSGGVAAGLLVGLRMAGLGSIVHAVRVADPIWANRRSISMMAAMVRRELRRAGAVVPRHDPTRLVLDTRYLGAGYGSPTTAGERAAGLAATEGFASEPTYSAKALAAAIDVAAGTAGPVLWIDTANAMPLEPLVGGEIPAVPAVLLPLLTGTTGR